MAINAVIIKSDIYIHNQTFYSKLFDSQTVIRTMEQNKEKTGYTIVTYRVRLYDRHFAWLQDTKTLYGEVTKHFLAVLRKEPELLLQSDFLLLRMLEEKCIGTKEMKAAGRQPEYPLTAFPKVPLYFRRSAINTAIDLARKQVTAPEQEASVGMTLYKGMYRNFSEDSIELKLLHNGKWSWVKYPFTGRKLPEGEKRLSPVLKLGKKDAWLNIPVSLTVKDASTVKERMQTAEKICAVYFPDHDVMAAAVVLDKEGNVCAKRFFHGGRQKEHQKALVFQHIAKSKQSRGADIYLQKESNEQTKLSSSGKTKENNRLYQQLQEINQYYAHSISRQILQYCLEQGVNMIVVPNYENTLDFGQKRYLSTNAYRWIGRSIINKLKYKAFAEGIVVTSVRPTHIVSRCSRCGAEISRYNAGHRATKQYHGGKLFYCACGHKGNTAENAAVNVGRTFLSYFTK